MNNQPTLPITKNDLSFIDYGRHIYACTDAAGRQERFIASNHSQAFKEARKLAMRGPISVKNNRYAVTYNEPGTQAGMNAFLCTDKYGLQVTVTAECEWDAFFKAVETGELINEPLFMTKNPKPKDFKQTWQALMA